MGFKLPPIIITDEDIFAKESSDMDNLLPLLSTAMDIVKASMEELDKYFEANIVTEIFPLVNIVSAKVECLVEISDLILEATPENSVTIQREIEDILKTMDDFDFLKDKAEKKERQVEVKVDEDELKEEDYLDF